LLHAFSFCYNSREHYYIWDYENGSLYETDFPIFLYLTTGDGTEEIKAEAEELKTNLKPPVSYSSFSKHTDIKALCLHICHDCNMKCGYCFADEGKYHTGRSHMPAEVAYAAIDMLIERSGKRQNVEIDFFGGEPLLNFDIVRAAVEYGKRKAAENNKIISFTLTTNALLLTEPVIEFLNREMENVVISIDGRAETHNAVRKSKSGGDTYDKALTNALNFIKSRGDKKYYIRGTFTHNNLDFCQDVKVLSDIGIRQISLEPAVLPENHKLHIRQEDIDIINKEYKKLAELYLDRINTDKWFNFFHFMIDLENGPCITKRLNGCGAGAEYAAVMPDGDIYPCHQFAGVKQFYIGNVLTKKFDKSVSKSFSRINVTLKEECKNCFAKYYCSGGCAANAYNHSGNIGGIYKQSCEMIKKRLELSLAISAINIL